MNRWHQHDRYLRAIDRRGAAEDTPLHRLPWLLLVLTVVLAVAWIRNRTPLLKRRPSMDYDTEHFGGEPPRRSA